MIKDGHFASNEIQDVLDELSTLILSVKQFIKERTKKLEDSLRSQQVIFDHDKLNCRCTKSHGRN